MKAFADVCVLLFVLSSVASVGVSLTVPQILASLERYRAVALSLLVNFAAAPILATAIARSVSLSEPQTVALILLGSASGAPFLPKLLEASDGDVPFSVALMVLLMTGSLIYLPLVLPLLLHGVAVDPLKIGRSLLVTMFLPLGLGLALKAWRPQWADGIRLPLNTLSLVTLVASLVLIPLTNTHGLHQLLSTMAIPACAMLILACFGAGFALGGSSQERQVTGFAAAARNIPAALLVGGQNFPHPDVVLMVVLSALVSVVVFVPVVAACRVANRRVGRQLPLP